MTVGLASALNEPATVAASTGLGNGLVVLSQLFTASQMVLEERFVSGHNVSALQAVGWEGVWGLCGLCALLVVLQHISTSTRLAIEDSIDAMVQIRNRPLL